VIEPEFLDLEDVLEIHEIQLARYGGGTGLRDRGALESAISQPAAGFAGEFLHQDLFEMAAAYAFHIAQNQPFVDGNKRTGLVSALVFLDRNGFQLIDPERRLEDAMIAIAERRMDKRGLAALMRELQSAR
jgi:death-on-curing protein